MGGKSPLRWLELGGPRINEKDDDLVEPDSSVGAAGELIDTGDLAGKAAFGGDLSSVIDQRAGQRRPPARGPGSRPSSSLPIPTADGCRPTAAGTTS